MKKTLLRNYAKLIARMGVNIEKGQEVVISADLDQPEFVAILVEECYRAGASRVSVDWNYQPLQKLHYRHQKLSTLESVTPWEEEKMKYYADTLPCRIHLVSEDPDGLKGINAEKMAKAQQARYQVLKPYRDAMEGKYQWCVAAVPGAAWARKVYPGMRTSMAIEKLWETILYASRALEDPIAAWEAHNRNLAARCDYLNNLQITELHYTAKNGTDFRVGLIPEGKFCGGADKSLTGLVFNANIPSEEVFTSPMRGQAEGIVYSTMPLSYQGQLIDNFSIRFAGGKVVEVHAEQNQALLEKMVAMDEGASYLGECALVPCSSPINQTGTLFYNTLFDENAACHLALGAGFTNVIKDYEKYSNKECHEKGVNDSMIHVDFMIGTADLSITAVTRDGKRVPVFENGNWAF